MNAIRSLPRRGAVLLFVAFGILGTGLHFLRHEEDPGPYVVDPADWICGLGDPRQLTDPARVDYDDLMEATPQMRELHRDGVDPESARGLILRSKAQAEVKRACEVVRRRFEHCSVWREIRRRDGGAIPERTKECLAEIDRPAPTPEPTARAAAEGSVARGGE